MLKRLVWMLSLFFCMLTVPLSAQSQNGSPNPRDIAVLQIRVDTVQKMVSGQAITEGQAQPIINQYLKDASSLTKSTLNIESLMNLKVGLETTPELNVMQKVAAYITFINFVWVLVIGLGVFCLGVILFHLSEVILAVPKVVWELGLYALIAYVVSILPGSDPAVQTYLTLLASVLFGCGLSLSSYLHINVKLEDAGPVLLFIHGVGTAILAIYFGSQLTAAVAILTLMLSIWFSDAYGKMFERLVPRTTITALLMLSAFVMFRLGGSQLGFVSIFEPGVFHICSIAGFGGLLIYSAKWYYSDGFDPERLLANLLMVGGALGMVFFGQYFDFVGLSKYAGTALGLWVLIKLFEIPAKSLVGYAFVGLICCVVIGYGAWYINLHPQTFAPYLIGL